VIQRLQSELLASQRSQQEAVSRANVLGSQTAVLQEQLLRAEEREKQLEAHLRERDSKLTISADKMQALDEVKRRCEQTQQQAGNDTEDKERQLQDVTRRLRDAERTLSKVMASHQSAAGSDGGAELAGQESPGAAAPSADAQEVRSQVVDELMRRLRLRERELNEANAKIEMLFSDKRRGSVDTAAMGLGGGVAREDSSMSVGSLSNSGASTAVSTASTQDSELEMKKLRERMKIVEEALRAMRDEAREHVLAIKSSDIVLNRLLGSGSFAEVHSGICLCVYSFVLVCVCVCVCCADCLVPVLLWRCTRVCAC